MEAGLPRPRLVVHPLLVLAAMALVAVIAFNLITTGFERAGVPRGMAGSLVALSLAGSLVNIPLHIREVPGEPQPFRIGHFVFLRRPVMERQVIAINVGGAVIPLVLSAWVLLENQSFWQTAVATLVVVVVTNRVARRVPGKGIEMPALLPPGVAALCAVLLSAGADGGEATAIAYTSGTVGTLVGADLLNIRNLRDMGSGMMSIGGAGVFDGVFLSGIVAAFLSW